MELKPTGLNVLLSKEDTENIRTQLKTLAISAIDEVKQQAGLSSDWIKGKAKCRQYLDGMSESKFEELSLPYRLINGIYYYNKREIDEYIFKNF